MKFSEIDFTNKNVYLAPYNNLLKLDETRLAQLDICIEGYIDNSKKGQKIIKAKEIKKNSIVIIISPNHWGSIINSLPSNVEYYVKINNQTYVKPSKIFNKQYVSFIYKREVYLNRLFNLVNDFIFDSAKRYGLYLIPNLWKMKNIKKTNKRVFVIGNGPSLKIEDLDKLKNDITIASNKIFLAFEQTHWRPTYYSIVDPLDIEEYYDEIKKHDLGLKFFPNVHKMKKMKDSIYYKLLKAKTYKDIKCTANILEGFYGGESVSFSMIDFAMSLGSKEIYLIGFDHNYSYPKGYEESLYKVSEGEVNHFHPDYRKKGDLWTEPRVENITVQFEIIKNFADKNNIKIFNATRGGYLEVFDRADFDSLFRDDK